MLELLDLDSTISKEEFEEVLKTELKEGYRDVKVSSDKKKQKKTSHSFRCIERTGGEQTSGNSLNKNRVDQHDVSSAWSMDTRPGTAKDRLGAASALNVARLVTKHYPAERLLGAFSARSCLRNQDQRPKTGQAPVPNAGHPVDSPLREWDLA